MRILLNKKSRKFLFEYLKKQNSIKTYHLLAKKKEWSYSTMKKWRFSELYIPSNIIPKEIENKLKIIDKKENNWGQIKGGIASAKVLKKFSPSGLEKRKEIGRISGKKNIINLKEKYGDKLNEMISEGKIRKRKKESCDIGIKNKTFFTNKNIFFDLSNVELSRFDKNKKLVLPKKLSPLLAEEIGAHVGDGTLSKKKYYFSIRCDKREKDYFTNFLFYAYKYLFNLNLNLLERGSISGFEVSSRGIYEFKNNVLGIVTGKKAYRIRVPKCILNSKNKDIYSSFLRGVFDTDGCITFRNGKYPLIAILIKSKVLIDDLNFMFCKLGYIPCVSGYRITLNGPVMVQKWINEIGSHNPKHLGKFEKANSIIGQYKALRYEAERP